MILYLNQYVIVCNKICFISIVFRKVDSLSEEESFYKKKITKVQESIQGEINLPFYSFTSYLFYSFIDHSVFTWYSSFTQLNSIPCAKVEDCK